MSSNKQFLLDTQITALMVGSGAGLALRTMRHATGKQHDLPPGQIDLLVAYGIAKQRGSYIYMEKGEYASEQGLVRRGLLVREHGGNGQMVPSQTGQAIVDEVLAAQQRLTQSLHQVVAQQVAHECARPAVAVPGAPAAPEIEAAPAAVAP